MRLLNANTHELQEFIGDEDVPPYAILSHTWGVDEVTFQCFDNAGARDMLGYAKIEYCCEQGVRDGLGWVWIDTCCIDKSSSAELSEAINSMFRWYQKAKPNRIAKCRWLTRGWTLQELIAPKDVVFYSKTWTNLGAKDELCHTLSQITGIEAETLQGEALDRVSIARRMSWAAKRTTTRTEDLAYCLLGIFDVNMPLLYGEGGKAFFRLQEEIIKSTSDQSVFAWGDSPIMTLESYITNACADRANRTQRPFRGISAESPSDFEHSGVIDSLDHLELEVRGWEPKPIGIHNRTVHVNFPIIKISSKLVGLPGDEVQYSFAALGCRKRDGYAINDAHYIGVPIENREDWLSVRYNKLVLIPRFPHLSRSAVVKPKIQNLKFAISTKLRWDFARLEQFSAQHVLHPLLPAPEFGVYLSHVHCGPSIMYDRQRGTIWTNKSFDCIKCYFLFRCSSMEPSFAVVIYGALVSETEEDTMLNGLKRIRVYGKVQQKDYDSREELNDGFFDDLRSGNSRWERSVAPVATAPRYPSESTGRSMKLVLSYETEIIITTQWFKRDEIWHEELKIDVDKNVCTPKQGSRNLTPTVDNAPQQLARKPKHREAIMAGDVRRTRCNTQ